MKRNSISFSVTDEERIKVTNIVNRARTRFPELDEISLQMDIVATHANGCPLDLDRLLKSDDFNFYHDVLGIYHNIDCMTGRLVNLFRPRFSRRSS